VLAIKARKGNKNRKGTWIMNARKRKLSLATILIVAFMALIFGCIFFEDNNKEQVIAMEDLPAAVKIPAEKETADCRIIEVEKEIKGTETIYSITYDEDGTEMEIEYTSEGKLIYKGKE
jgi:hypothetical protein